VSGNFELKEHSVLSISNACTLTIGENLEFKEHSTAGIHDNCEITVCEKLEIKENAVIDIENNCILEIVSKVEIKSGAEFSVSKDCNLEIGSKLEVKSNANVDISDSLVELNGDFELKPNSHVTMNNTIFKMNCSEDNKFGILVKESAYLDVYNSTITANIPRHYYWFAVYGSMKLINSEVYYTAGSIEIYSNNALIDACTIANSEKVGIFIKDSSPTSQIQLLRTIK
jgi:hypothetical protein